MTTHALRVRLMGDPAVLLPDGRAVALERRAAALLALAALEPGISRLRVASLLWPDSADPRRNLRQQLLRFRQQFGHPLVQGEGTLNLDAPLLDTTDDASPQAPTLLAGIEFDDVEPFAQWLQAQREGLRARRAKRLDAELAMAEREHRLDDALATARALLADDPTAETHHRTLIRLHYLNQDHAGARAAFDTLRQMLGRELGTRPSAETLALMRLVDQAVPLPNAVRVWITTLQRPPRMVGRARELQAVHQALADRRALLLQGEAGMGKSRLLAEGLEPSPQQVTVKAQAGDAGVPYATLARLLRRLLDGAGHPTATPALARLLPEIRPAETPAPVPLPPGGERLMLQAAVEQVIGHAGLHALAVDDLHFADDASLEMFTALVGAEALAPLAWLFTQRPGEGSPAAAALRDALEEARSLETVDLAPLDAAQMVELVRSLDLPEIDADTLGPRLLRHSGGNPLFALETLKHLLLPGAQGHAMPQPASVGALIDRRLKRLSDPALALARVAAIAGADFSIALAEHAIGARAVELANAWAELEAAQVLRDNAFAHDLVLDAVLRSVPAPIAQHLHGQLAQYLVSHQGEPARIAAHWQAAGDQRRAAQAWMEAAGAADRCLRYRESMQCFEHAAALLETLGDGPALHQAIQGAVDQASLLSLLPEAYAAMVERLVASAPDAPALARAMIYRLRTLELAGNMEQLLKEADRAVAIARAEQMQQTEGYALMGRSTARVYLGHLEDALGDFQRVAEIGAALGDSELEGVGHSSAATTLARMGRSAAALADLDIARNIFARHQHHLRLAMAEQLRGVLHLGRGHPAAALEAAEAALRGANEVEAPFDVLAHCALVRGMALRHLGRYGESMDVLEALLGPDTPPEHWATDRLHLDIAQTCTHLARIDLAVRHLAQARAPGRLQPAEQQRALAVELQLRALGHDAAKPLPELPEWRGEPRRRCELLRARAALVPGEERVALIDEALKLASQFELADEQCAAQAALAAHLLNAGQVQAARELIRVALRDASVVPAGYPPAVAAVAHAVLVASGEHEAARRVLQEAVGWIERAASTLKPAFRSSFVERNAVNCALLQAARTR